MEEHEHAPLGFSLLTYAWVMALSLWGGAVGFYQKVKTGKARLFNITELIGELATSSLSGLLVFWLCEQAEIAPLYAAVLIAIAGHMGSRTIFVIEHIMEKKLAEISNLSINDSSVNDENRH